MPITCGKATDDAGAGYCGVYYGDDVGELRFEDRVKIGRGCDGC